MARGFVASRDRAQLERLAQAFGVSPTDAQLSALARYLELVASWNTKLDLTAARDTEPLIEVMLADAFALTSLELVGADSRCIDVGSGAGAPSVPLAILRGDLTLQLLEPLRKRVAFLRTVLGTLQLVARVAVHEQKLDPSKPSVPGAPFDLALSRATFAPELWLPAGMQLASHTLVLLAGQPPPAADGAELERTIEYTLPFSGASRRIARYRAASHGID